MTNAEFYVLALSLILVAVVATTNLSVRAWWFLLLLAMAAEFIVVVQHLEVP